MSSDNASRIETAVRDFIWRHWYGRIPGSVQITRFSKEGEPTTFSFEVNPDAEGRWRVSVHNRTLMFRMGQHFDLKRDHIFYSVKRVETSGSSNVAPVTVYVPDTEDRSPSSYRLALIDDGGKIVFRQ